jgi:hypothetical protein
LTAENSPTQDLAFSLVILNANANLKGVPVNRCQLFNLFLRGSKRGNPHLMQGFLTFRDHQESLMPEYFMNKVRLWIVKFSCLRPNILGCWPNLKC